MIINLNFLIILAIMDIFQITEIDNKPIITFFYLLTKIIMVILYSIEDNFAKIILTHNALSPYSLIFLRGLFVNTLATLFSVIFIYIELPDENGENSCVFTRLYKMYENKLDILRYIGMLIMNFLYNINLFLVLDKFTPNHLSMTAIMGYVGYLLNSLIFFQDIELSEFFIRLTVYIILIIATSIHNEFIILKFCNFHRYTRLFLEKEAERDKSEIEINVDLNDIQNNEMDEIN